MESSGNKAAAQQARALALRVDPEPPAASIDAPSAAAASHARAIVEARLIVAMKRPRDIDEVRERILRDCKRPGFAAMALWHRPVGTDKRGEPVEREGPSIRLAESCIRHMGNVDIETTTQFDSVELRVLRVAVTDLESNVRFALDVPVPKTVERRRLRDGEMPIAKRTNAAGEMVYVLAASEDALITKQWALASKAIRTCGLRLVPADVLDEAIRAVRQTIADETAKDPDAARKRILDGFAELNVPVADLKRYLGHDVAQCSPAELEALRGLYVAIRDGATTWAEALAERDKEAAPATGRVDATKAAIHAKAEGAEPSTVGPGVAR